MIEMDGGFQIGDIYVYPAEADAPQHKFYYVVTRPQPETDAQGRPTLLAMPMSTGGFVQLGAHLGLGSAESAALAALRSQVEQRLRTDSPAAGQPAPELELQPAPLQVTGAQLQLGRGAGAAAAEPEELASSSTAGFYPFTALFSAPLNAEQQTRVSAALNGRPGFLQVSYSAGLPTAVHASARVAGDLRRSLRDLLADLGAAPAPVSDADLRELAQQHLERAFEAGSLTGEAQSTARGPQLVQRAMQAARSAMLEVLVAAALRELRSPPDQATAPDPNLARAETSASLSETQVIPLHLSADVASWFDGGPSHGMDHIVLPPGN